MKLRRCSLLAFTALAWAAAALGDAAAAQDAGALTDAPRRPDIVRRTRAAAVAAAAAAVGDAPTPIDMRVPCAAGSPVPCVENVDVIRPVEGLDGPSVGACAVQMVPLLPFPCGFDNNTLIGIPGQKTDYCGNGATTDGFYNLYRAPLPASGAGSGCAQYAAAAPAARVVVRLRFLVAAGRQFDRMFQAFVGGSAVMIGTTAEPGPAVDKKYNVSADVTDLQAALKPGSPVLFSLTQGMDNTYNVPFWAEAFLDFYYAPSPSAPVCAANKRIRAPAEAPWEVVPLLEPGWEARPPPQAYAHIVGKSTSPPWPSVTFPLPSNLSSPRTIAAAEVRLIAKNEACEEFWAMSPPSWAVNSSGYSCGGAAFGEPYREARVYVDGSLAGMSPLYYNTFTGGVQFQMWDAVPAYKAFSLPVYRFDLGPFLGLLNDPSAPHDVTVRIVGASTDGWGTAASLLLRRGARIVTAEGPPAYKAAPPDAIPASKCDLRSTAGGTAGKCRLEVAKWRLSVSTKLLMTDPAAPAGAKPLRYAASVDYGVAKFTNDYSFSPDADTVNFTLAVKHSAASALKRVSGGAKKGEAPAPPNARSSIDYAWANAGSIVDMGVWVNSYNLTGTDNGARVSQRHYQHLWMVTVVPTRRSGNCSAPFSPTATVRLQSYDARDCAPDVKQDSKATWCDYGVESYTVKSK